MERKLRKMKKMRSKPRLKKRTLRSYSFKCCKKATLLYRMGKQLDSYVQIKLRLKFSFW